MKRIQVLFENDFCMVLEKPAGLAVQGGEGVGVSLDSILQETFTPRPLLVHRLDKDTSGLILTAKNSESAAFFSGLFREGDKRINKQYTAVVKGRPDSPEGTISIDLDIRGRMKQTVTSYKILFSSYIQNNGVQINSGLYKISFLELELGTGRMHQIRRHLSMVENPVLGDDKYGDFKLNKELRKIIGLKHLLLHASRLVIKPCELLPQGLDIQSRLPDYFPAV